MSGPAAVPLLEEDDPGAAIERALLGALMNADTLTPKDLEVRPDDFAEQRHGIIFAALLDLKHRGQGASEKILTAELSRLRRLDYVGGRAYLAVLQDAASEGRPPAFYVPRLLADSKRRNLEQNLKGAAEDLRSGADPGDVVSNITDGLARLQQNANGAAKSLRVLTATELLEMTFPPVEKILAPILGEKTLAMMYAPRGAGKTYLSLSIGLAAASGGTVFGEDSGRPSWRAETPHSVLYVDGEMPGELLKHRVAELVSGLDLEPENRFKIIAADLEEDGIPSLATREGQDLVEAHVSPGSLLILDNNSTLCRGIKENEADGWDAMQEWLLGLRRRRVAVLLVHHAGRNGLARGTSKREDVLDVVLQLATPDDYDAEEGARFEVNFTKSRGLTGRAVESFEALLDVREGRATWRTRDVAEELTERMLAMKAAGRSMRQIAAEMAVDHSTVVRRIQKAEKKAKRGRS